MHKLGFVFFLSILLQACQSFDVDQTSDLGFYSGEVSKKKDENPLYLEHNFIPCWNKVDCLSSYRLKTDSDIYSELLYVSKLEDPSYFEKIFSKYCSKLSSSSFVGSHKNKPTLMNISKSTSALAVSKCLVESDSLWVVLTNSTQAVADESILIEKIVKQVNKAMENINVNQ